MNTDIPDNIKKELAELAYKEIEQVKVSKILTKLLVKTVASCECDTKTNLHEKHDEMCLYRILMEAYVKIDELQKNLK